MKLKYDTTFVRPLLIADKNTTKSYDHRKTTTRGQLDSCMSSKIKAVTKKSGASRANEQ